ncbi:hypothetical protein H8E88_15965 [candidate division KSB1 bacterium]|nr:hypothetical protein [candidate division KSB1 bacterium]
MTKHIFIFIILICSHLICWVPQTHADEKSVPKTIHWDISKIPIIGDIQSIEGFYKRIYDFEVGDFDEDGKDEIVVLKQDSDFAHYIAVRELDENVYTFDEGIPVKLHESAQFFIKIYNHFKFSCLTYRTDSTKGFIDIYDKKLKLLNSISTIRGFDFTNDDKWSGYLRSAYIIDINSDLREDLLVDFNTGDDLQPRAMLGYDLLTKQKIFDVHFSPLLHYSRFVDMNTDGKMELIVGLAGASNGPQFGDFALDSSYLAIIDENGNTLKKRSFGGKSSYIYFDITKMNKDDIPDFVIGFRPAVNHSHEHPSIQVIDGKTLKSLSTFNLQKYSLSPEIVFVKDFNKDQNQEILTFDITGRIALFHFDKDSNDLRLDNFATYESYIHYSLSYDLNSDGKDELFFHCANPAGVIVVDAELNPIFWFPIEKYEGDKFKILPECNSAKENNRFVFLSNGKLFQVSLISDDIFPPPVFNFNCFGIKLNWGIGKFIGLLFLIILVILIPTLLFVRQQNFLSIPESNRIGWIITGQTGKIKKYNHTFLKLTNLHPNELHKPVLQLAKEGNILNNFNQIFANFLQSNHSHSFKEIYIGPPGKRKVFGVELFRTNYRQKNSPVLLLLIDLTETKITEQAQIWASMAQRVAHKIKTPLGTILLAIQRLQRNYQKNSPEHSGDYDKLANTAITEIERVRETINVFMKIARLDSPNFQENELSVILKDALKEYQRRLPEGVEIKTTFENHSLNVKIDEKHFKEALFNIFDNAITAMESLGQIQISTNLEVHPLQEYGSGNFAVLEITDNGKGMTKDELEKLFTPGFTTSDHGSGMGLIIAKNIIKNHSGKIDVHSTEGIGTTFTIRVPLVAKSTFN